MHSTVFLLGLLGVELANAGVFWGNPRISIIMDGAIDASGYLDSVTYACPGTPPSVYTVGETVDLLAGYDLPADVAEDCTAELEFSSGPTVDGGTWTVEVTETIILDEPGDFLLAYDVLLGTPSGTPRLNAE